MENGGFKAAWAYFHSGSVVRTGFHRSSGRIWAGDATRSLEDNPREADTRRNDSFSDDSENGAQDAGPSDA
jgi:hypothetical protein